MIESRRSGLDLGLSSHMEAEVVEYRLGWRSRLRLLLTGVVRVWRIPATPRDPHWMEDTGIIPPDRPRGVIVNIGPPAVLYSDEEDEW